MKRLLDVILCALTCLAVSTPTDAVVRQAVLHNGLTVLVEENHTNPLVTVQVLVRAGSIYEQEYLGSGISHFFEHIIHGGTTSNRTEAESRALSEAIGNSSNAYTTTDHTGYYINTTTEHWTTALDLLADWMLNSTIEQDEFEREKGVVQRELEQGLDSPRRMLYQTTVATRYKVHPARYSVIGYKELVLQVTRDDLLTYYHRMYAPNNMILVVVGDVQTDDALARIRTAFGNGKRRHIPAIVLPEEPPQVGKRIAVKEMAVAQAHMSLSFPTVNLHHPDLYPLDILSFILSNGESSRLVKRIKDEQQLVYSIRSSSFTPAYAPGSLAVWATLETDNLEAAEAAILQALYRLKDELVRPEELAKAKKQKIADQVFGQQTVQARARAIGIDMLSTFDPNFSATYVRKIQNVTAQDIRRVARQYLHEDTLTVVDWRAGKPVKTIAFESGSRPHMLTLSPDGKRLWVQERDASKLSIYDTKSFERVARIPVGRTPAITEFTPSGRYTLTTHIGERFVKVFDAGTLKKVKTIEVGRNPVNAIVEPGGRYAYVTNWGSNTVSVIDVERWEVVKTIKVGTRPFGIYLFDPSTGKMAGNR